MYFFLNIEILLRTAELTIDSPAADGFIYFAQSLLFMYDLSDNNLINDVSQQLAKQKLHITLKVIES